MRFTCSTITDLFSTNLPILPTNQGLVLLGSLPHQTKCLKNIAYLLYLTENNPCYLFMELWILLISIASSVQLNVY